MIAASLHRRLRSTVALLPRGRMLPAEVWRRRHQVIVRLAVAQALALLVFGLARGLPISEAALGAAAVAAPLLAALPAHFSRGVRSTATSVSLFLASTVLVHFWGGQTEAHFHFFVMVGVVALYQDWLPFGVGLAIVVVHHGVLGTLQPHQVFSHHEAMAHPWSWAAVHAGFVLAASVAHLTSWRLNEHQGLHDPLTGLANRTLLREGLTRSLARGLPVSVVLIDLDDFKDVNDSRGHAAGDRLLLAVAERLDASARGAGEIARLGGDEFAVSVPAGAEAARRVGERFVAGLAQPVHVDGRQLSVHASIGVADSATLSGPASPGPCHAAARADELLRNTDLALHRANAGGKNRVVGYATS